MEKQENLHAGHRERMIKRFLQYPESLSDHELLEVVLYFAINRRDTNPLAHKLLKVFGSIPAILNAGADKLKAVDGIGNGTATMLTLLGKFVEIAKEKREDKKSLSSPETVIREIKNYFDGEEKEIFLLILLDGSRNKIATVQYTDNNAKEVNADIPDISRAIAIHKPKYAIIAHNHPSGVPLPSSDDDMATIKINFICEVSGIVLLDHIIYGDGKTFSYHSQNRMSYVKHQSNINTLLNKLEENYNANN